jgi:hypothetical protein
MFRGAKNINEVELVHWLSSQLHVNSLEDWYRVSVQHIRTIASLPGKIKYFFNFQNLIIRWDAKDLAAVLSRVYPEHKWEMEKLLRQSGPIKSSQRLLRLAVEEIFPSEGIQVKVDVEMSDVQEEYLHPFLVHAESERQIELDIYIPRLNLAFEYQV